MVGSTARSSSGSRAGSEDGSNREGLEDSTWIRSTRDSIAADGKGPFVSLFSALFFRPLDETA